MIKSLESPIKSPKQSKIVTKLQSKLLLYWHWLRFHLHGLAVAWYGKFRIVLFKTKHFTTETQPFMIITNISICFLAKVLYFVQVKEAGRQWPWAPSLFNQGVYEQTLQLVNA